MLSRKHLGTRRKVESTKWRISIPNVLALDIDLMLYNPALGKPIYGARSQLITDLLEQYMAKIKRGEETYVQPDDPIDFGPDEPASSTGEVERTSK